MPGPDRDERASGFEAISERGFDEIDSLSFLPKRSLEPLQKRWPWTADVAMGNQQYSDTGSFGTAGLESCVGIGNCGYRSHPGRIIGYINTATYQAQIQAIEQLVPQHSGPLTGAIAYIRVRTTAGPSSPTTQARAMVEKAAQDIFAKLHIHAGVVKLPAGGPRVFPVRCTSVLTQRRCLTMERITR